MSLHYIYSNASNSTLDITQYCRLYEYASTTDAKEGSVGMSTLIVDDQGGTLDFTGHRRLYTYEDLAPANEQVVHNGYIAGENVSRGPYRIGAGRIWTLRIADTNVLLNRRIMNGTDANRSAENDLQRIQALLTMTELNTIDDSLYVNLTAATTAMDPVDYRGQPAGTGYIADCAQASGKNYFAWYREATGENSLWYDFASSSNWSSTIRLTNSLADVDDTTTFAIDLENQAELDRDPSRVASGIYLTYDGGTVYVQNAATTATFGAIDYAAPSSNVKTLAKATARANRYLADASAEDDLINVSVKLPSANVNDILAGMRVECSFSHLPGYEAYSWMRCLSRTVTEISEDPTRAYRLDLELAPKPIVSCLTQANLISIFDSGEIGGGSPEPTANVPISETVPAPSERPSLVLSFFTGVLGGTDIGWPLTVSSPWDVIDSYAPAAAGRHLNTAVCAVPLASGSPTACTITWDGQFSTQVVYRMLGFSISTSATAPVQIGSQLVTGAGVTLGSTPTPGNLLVCFYTATINGDDPPPTQADINGLGLNVDWTLKGAEVIANDPGSVTDTVLVVMTHCVEEGDPAELDTIEGGFSHWNFIQEWEIS